MSAELLIIHEIVTSPIAQPILFPSTDVDWNVPIRAQFESQNGTKVDAGLITMVRTDENNNIDNSDRE